MADPAADDLLNTFREIVESESEHDVVEDGLYKGCIIRYKSGITIYHPYVPFTTYGVSTGDIKVGEYPAYEDVLLQRANTKVKN